MRHRPSFRTRVLALAVFLLPLLAPAAMAQEESPEPRQDIFGEIIEVRVVNLEVVVTDGDGNRVTGLDPDDFQLYVDGDETPIDYFSEIVGGAAVEPPESLADSRIQGIPLAVPGEAVGTRYLVFIDDFFLIARDRNQILREMADDLAFLGPGDQMAIVAYDGKKVEMLTSWTDSERQLRRALSDAQARPAQGLQRIADLRSHDQALYGARTARSVDALGDLPVQDRFFANQVANRVERAVSAAVATLRGFAQPPGRRVMLLLSGGWPFSPSAYVAGSRQIIESSSSVPTGEDLLEPLVDTANLTGYTIYTIDVPGLGSASGADVEQGGRLATGLNTESEARFDTLSSRVVVDRESNQEDALRYIAAETGGRALINAAGVEALAATAQDTRSYYWLGFSPERQRDDRRHKIRVEVTRPGLDVRTRDTYLDMSREAERTMAVESALLFGDPAAEGSLGVQVGEPERAGRRTMNVPITVAIPIDLVTALQEGDEWVIRTELRVAALDESSRQSEVPSVPVEFRFKQRPEAGKAIPYTTNLKLRRAEQVLVVSITDVVGGRSLTSRVEVTP